MTTRQRRHTRTHARQLLTVVAVSALTFGLSACSSAGETSGEITITVQNQANQKQIFDVLVPAFEKENPDITVEIQSISDDQKATTNTQVITGSNPPDVAYVPVGSNPYAAAIKVGALAPLDDVWAAAELSSRYAAPTAAFATAADGKPYVVATDNILYDIAFYNKDLFAQAGVDVPADHRIPDNETLYAMTEKFAAEGIPAVGLNGKDVFAAGWLVDGLLPTSASSDELANYFSSYNPDVEVEAEYTDPAFTAVVTQLQDWASHEVFQPGFLGQDLATTSAQFQQGATAMFIGGNFSVTDLTKSGVNYDWLLLPPVEGSNTKVQIPSYQGDSWAAPVKGKNLDAAKKFLEFMVSDEMQVEAFGNNGVLPIVNSVPASELTGLDPVVSELIEDSSENGAPTGWSSAVPGAVAQTVIGSAVQSLWSGQSTVDQVAETQQAALEEYRSSN